MLVALTCNAASHLALIKLSQGDPTLCNFRVFTDVEEQHIHVIVKRTDSMSNASNSFLNKRLIIEKPRVPALEAAAFRKRCNIVYGDRLRPTRLSNY